MRPLMLPPPPTPPHVHPPHVRPPYVPSPLPPSLSTQAMALPNSFVTALVLLGMTANAQTYQASLWFSPGCAPAVDAVAIALAVGQCVSSGGVSYQLSRNAAPANTYTYTTYEAPGCIPTTQVMAFLNVPMDGTTCVNNGQ